MSIANQIKILRQIQRDLKVTLKHEPDEEAKAELTAQIEGLRWAIDTLENTRQLVNNISWLQGVK